MAHPMAKKQSQSLAKKVDLEVLQEELVTGQVVELLAEEAVIDSAAV